MAESATTTRPWTPAFKLLIRGFVLTILCATIVYATVLVLPLMSDRLGRVVAISALGFLALVTAFGALVCLGLGVIRWALLDMSVRQLDRAYHLHRQLLGLTRSINDRLQASDMSKRIVYRKRDREALRTAIREDIVEGELDAALTLVKIMSQMYGYHDEAEQLRDQVERARSEETDRRVTVAIGSLDEVLTRCAWEEAADEAAKIQRRFPDSPRVRQLHQRVAHARENHKHSLERQFLEAARRDDVDRAMELLRELDKYLTEAEAEPFRETARGVIGKKRDNLGVQFKLAVHDREWTQAVRVGEQLIREFPNTKMADEVRGMIEVLRERATSQPAIRA